MRMNLESSFKEALKYLNDLEKQEGAVKLKPEMKVELRALENQITKGKCQPSFKPSWFKCLLSPVKGQIYTKWNTLGNLSKDDAMKQFIQLIEQLQADQERLGRS